MSPDIHHVLSSIILHLPSVEDIACCACVCTSWRDALSEVTSLLSACHQVISYSPPTSLSVCLLDPMREMTATTVAAALAALDGLTSHGFTVTSLIMDDCKADCLVPLWGETPTQLSLNKDYGGETEKEGEGRDEEEDEGEEEAEAKGEREGGGGNIDENSGNGSGGKISIVATGEGNGASVESDMASEDEKTTRSRNADPLTERNQRETSGDHASSDAQTCHQAGISLPKLWSGSLKKLSTTLELPAHPVLLFRRCCNLQVLRLRSNAVDGGELIDILQALPRLRELCLTEWDTDEEFQAEVQRGEYQHGMEPVLRAISRLADLTHLDLTESVFTSALLRLLLPLTGLQALILDKAVVTEAEGMDELEAELHPILQLTSLTCLKLSLPDDLMPDGFLRQLPSLPSLRSVCVCFDTQEGFASLVAVTTLTRYAVSPGFDLTDAQLGMLQQLPLLESLDLSGDTFDCLNALTPLTRLTSLRLDLEGAEFKSEHGLLLSRMTGLERLCLPFITFQPGSLTEVCSALSRLTCLEVPSSFVNDQDVVAFARFPALRALNFELCRGVSEGRVREFVRERQRGGFPRMEGIDIRGTKLPGSCVPSRLLHYFAVRQSCFE